MTDKTEAQRRISDALAQADRAEAAAINYGEGTTLGLEAYASAKTIRTQADRIASLEAELNEQCRLLGMSAERELALQAQLFQRQAVPTEKLHNACTYALEWLNECGGNLAHNVVDVLEQALAASPTPPARKPLTDEQIAGLDNFVRGTIHGRFARAKAFTQGVERKHGIGATHD